MWTAPYHVHSETSNNKEIRVTNIEENILPEKWYKGKKRKIYWAHVEHDVNVNNIIRKEFMLQNFDSMDIPNLHFTGVLLFTFRWLNQKFKVITSVATTGMGSFAMSCRTRLGKLLKTSGGSGVSAFSRSSCVARGSSAFFHTCFIFLQDFFLSCFIIGSFLWIRLTKNLPIRSTGNMASTFCTKIWNLLPAIQGQLDEDCSKWISLLEERAALEPSFCILALTAIKYLSYFKCSKGSMSYMHFSCRKLLY